MLSAQYIPREFVLSMERSLDAVKCDVRLLLAQYVRPYMDYEWLAICFAGQL